MRMLARRIRSVQWMSTVRLTKLVTTIGPSSEAYEPLSKVVAAGMNVMRLNFSHATADEFHLRVGNLAKAGATHVATLLDTRGPEIRMGGLAVCSGDRKAKIELAAGQTLELTTDAAYDGKGDESKMFVNYPLLPKKARPGTAILLDDGAVSVTVEDVLDDGVRCRVDNTGLLGERKGVNMPGVTLDLPAMSDKDTQDIMFGIQHGIDVVAASFVHDAAGVQTIRDYVDACAAQHPTVYPNGERPLIVAKIESLEALRNLDDIIDVADGIMVARGDLGVEVPLVQVCQWQKDIVGACRAKGKPVIVATQMLDTMSRSPRPTRAEVADVTNAVLERADAVMLSGESANGDWPVQAVQTQHDICESTEQWQQVKPQEPPLFVGSDPMARTAVFAQRLNNAKAIAVKDDQAGSLARRLAACAPDVPILAQCSSPRIARQLALFRGVTASVVEDLDALTVETLLDTTRSTFRLDDHDPIVVFTQASVSLAS